MKEFRKKRKDNEENSSSDNKKSYYKKGKDSNSAFKPRRTFNKDNNSYEDTKKRFSSEKGSFKLRKKFENNNKSGNKFKKSSDFQDNKEFKPRRFSENQDFIDKKTRFVREKAKENLYKSKERPNYQNLESQANFIKNKYKNNKNKGERKNKEDHNKNPDELRLNRYIAKAGICSRREADELIKKGKIKVNGQVITELGYKINKKDKVEFDNKVISIEKFVYILLNKPKNYITTTEDPEERLTVMDLIKNACEERVYPVGRLDRDTTGLLLLTNDGDLAQKLSHPSNKARKVYHVTLNQPISMEDIEKLSAGIELEDGLAQIDALEILDEDRLELSVEVHIGRNRIIRRIFEHLGYEVIKLDRTLYAGLTKKDVPRGKWRFLTPQEVIRIKYLQKN
jgi:23S rRNA pseudouridine2605 synthase